jgi:hypothetical protein
MSPRSILIKVLFLVAFLLAATAQAQDEPVGPRTGLSKTVRAVGKAQAGGVAAEDEALRDALRKAVEQGAGQFISTVSMTQDYQLVLDRIFTDVKGFVERYKILQKYTQGDVLCIEIEAVVSVDAFRAGWAKLQALIDQWGKRRFMCIVTDKIDNREDQGHSAQTAIENVFLKRGFPMVDQAQVEQVRERDKTATYTQGDLQSYVAFGKRFGAEVMLVGDANAGEAETQNIYGQNLVFYHPSVEIKAIRVDNAMLIASESANIRKGSTNRMAAAKEALREAGAKVANQIIDKVIEAMLTDTMGRGGLVQVVVFEIGGLRNSLALQKALKEIRGVTNVFQREMSGNMLTLDVETTIPAQEFGARLLEIREPKMDVTSITANRIDARVVK